MRIWSKGLVGMQNGTTTLGMVGQFLKKLRIHLPYDSAFPFLDIFPKEVKAYIHTKTYTEVFTSALFIITLNCKQFKCPSTDE